MNHIGSNILLQVLVVLVAFPVVVLLLYVLTRIVSLAFLHSWWDTKLWYNKKLLNSFKENTTKKEEGENHGST
jgi:hypothetical protein